VERNITIIKNAQIVTENGILWDGSIVIKEGRIVQIGNMREAEWPLGAIQIDAKGAYVGPGFVDIHVHGGGGFDTCLEVENAAEYFLSHGETSILATSYCDRNLNQLIECIRAVREGMKYAKNLKGMYMEGPFTNPNYGAKGFENPWRKTIGKEEYEELVNEAGDLVKVWVIAPERTDVLPFLKYAKKVNPNVIFAIGHSEATPMQIRALGKYRPILQTHSLNATGRQTKDFGGLRAYGPDEYCFKEHEVYTELISDSCGIHVHPELQQLLLHNKGIYRTILISDSTIDDNPVPSRFSNASDLNFDCNGGISGSKLTMKQACKNVMQSTNCGIAQAFIMGATTPARVLGMGDEIGSIEIGKQADLVFVDDKFNVERVLHGGTVCY